MTKTETNVPKLGKSVEKNEMNVPKFANVGVVGKLVRRIETGWSRGKN